MTPDILKLIAQGGAGVIAIGIAIFAAGSGEKPRWVFGREHRETVDRLEEEVTALRAERDTERELNLRLLGVTEKAITVAKQPTVRKVAPR